MSSPASIANHPFHPMFIVFPIGLWIFSLACDIIFLAGGPAAWQQAAIYSMGAGVLGALAAAIPGLVDLLSLPHSRAKRVGVWHMSMNLFLVALFVVNFIIRLITGAVAGLPLILSIIGVILLLISGWLGGELVYVHGVAVAKGADLNRKTIEPQHDRPKPHGVQPA